MTNATCLRLPLIRRGSTRARLSYSRNSHRCCVIHNLSHLRALAWRRRSDCFTTIGTKRTAERAGEVRFVAIDTKPQPLYACFTLICLEVALILRSEVEFLQVSARNSVRMDVALLLRYWNGEDCEPGVDLQAVWQRVQQADRDLTRQLLPVVTFSVLSDLARKIRVSFGRKMAIVGQEREWTSLFRVLGETAWAVWSWANLCAGALGAFPIEKTVHFGRIHFFAR